MYQLSSAATSIVGPGNLYFAAPVERRMTEPDPSIEAPVRKAYFDLMAELDAKLSPEDSAALRQDIEHVWAPRERQAFNVSV